MINTEEQAVWKIYPEIPFIEANQFGEIRTKDRYVKTKDRKKQFVKGRILKQLASHNRYMYVQLRLNGKKVHLLVHRVIAACFIPNPDNLPEVNHKDNNPKNNTMSNLEWCTSQYNTNYKKNFGTAPAQLQGRPTIAVKLDTFEVLWFDTQKEATHQLGVYGGNIYKVIKGEINKTGGCWFVYADENAVEKTREKFGNDIAKKVEKLLNEHLN